MFAPMPILSIQNTKAPADVKTAANILTGTVLVGSGAAAVASALPASISGLAIASGAKVSIPSTLKLAGAVGGGFLLASLFGGQKQEASQTVAQTAAPQEQSAFTQAQSGFEKLLSTNELLSQQILKTNVPVITTQHTTYTVSGGENYFGGVSSTPYVAPAVSASQIPSQTPSITLNIGSTAGTQQAASQEQTSSNVIEQLQQNSGMIIALIAAAAVLFLAFKSKKRKK